MSGSMCSATSSKTRLRWELRLPTRGAELWFDSAEEIAHAFNEPTYLETIRPDEHKFAELADCVSFVTQEVPIA
jgi:hypothetical protein